MLQRSSPSAPEWTHQVNGVELIAPTQRPAGEGEPREWEWSNRSPYGRGGAGWDLAHALAPKPGAGPASKSHPWRTLLLLLVVLAVLVVVLLLLLLRTSCRSRMQVAQCPHTIAIAAAHRTRLTRIGSRHRQPTSQSTPRPAARGRRPHEREARHRAQAGATWGMRGQKTATNNDFARDQLVVGGWQFFMAEGPLETLQEWPCTPGEVAEQGLDQKRAPGTGRWGQEEAVAGVRDAGRACPGKACVQAARWSWLCRWPELWDGVGP
jgi:hypothetical protein